jgi:hypothetical protein
MTDQTSTQTSAQNSTSPEDEYFMTNYRTVFSNAFRRYPKFASDKLKWNSETKLIRFRAAGFEQMFGSDQTFDLDRLTDDQIINFYNTLSPSEKAYVGL